MMDNQKHPREFDAVHGGDAPPISGAVLGGIEGVKQRLASSVVEARVTALSEALNYGESGLDLVIQALEDKSRKVRKTATSLLRGKETDKARIALNNFKFWIYFEILYDYSCYAKKFANRRIIEFDGQTSITDTANTAYALRTFYKRDLFGNWEFGMKAEDKLHKLLQDSRANEIEALVFGLWTDDRTSASIVNALVEANQKLTNLKAVFVGDIQDLEYYISPMRLTNFSPLLEAYPNLEVLQVRGTNGNGPDRGDIGLEFAPALKHEKLKALIVESGVISHLSISQICKLELPALEYLELWLGSYFEVYHSINDLMPIISGVFPKLKYLGLRKSEYSDDIAFRIVNSPIVENLVELDLSMGNLGDDGAEALLKCPAISQLDTLNVSENYLTDQMLEKLNKLDIEVISDGQKYYEDRYDSVAE